METTSKPKFVYVTYIATTPEKLWEALTKADFTRSIGSEAASSPSGKPARPSGSKLASLTRTGTVKCCNATPPTALLHFSSGRGSEHFTRVIFQLEQHGPVVKLTLTHDELDEKDDKFFIGISQGWPAVLSNLKSLLEGGNPLTPRPC